MSGQTIVGISILITIVLYPFYIFIIRKVRANANDNSRAVRAMREGQSVVARVIKVDRHHGAPFSSAPGDEYKIYYTVTYEYVVNGKKYRKMYYDEQGDSAEEIRMYYFPNNPKKAYSEGNSLAKSKKKIGCLSIFIIPTIFMFILAKILLAILLVDK